MRLVTRIIIDSNVMRRGHFSVAALADWVDAAGGGEVTILVPEVVLWEWAEHASLASATLAAQHADFPVEPAIFTPPAIPTFPPKDELVDLLAAKLPAGVEVWEPKDSEWREAVQEQVLQIGVGERKEGIKTGASDAIVRACVRSQIAIRSGTEAVILATNDKHLRRACVAEFGDEVLFANGTRDLWSRLIEFAPAKADLTEEVEEQLRTLVTDPASDIGSALQAFATGFEIVSYQDGRPREVERELARLGRVDIVELHDLNVGESELGSRVGVADVRLFADVHMTVLTLRDLEGGGLEWIQTFDGLVKGGMIDIPVNVTFDQHWQLQSASPAGIARINFNQFAEDGDEELD